MVKKADGLVPNANAANAFSNSFKAATGGASVMNRLKGMVGMGPGATNVASR